MFKLHVVASLKTEVLEKFPVTNAEEVVVGELLKLADGKLTKASGTDVPQFIAESGVRDGFVTVKRIYEDEIYETKLAADGTALNIGDKVTIHEDGLKATATTESGVFEICEILDAAEGGAVRGLFRR